jgi:hypothetical protein
MRRSLTVAQVIILPALPLVLATTPVLAHGIAGKRVFPTTLTIDDPAVSDEASIPTVMYQRHGTDDGGTPFRETDITGEFDKRITEHLGVGFNYGYTIQDQIGQPSLYGFQNLNTTLKYQFLQNAPHELLMSVGVIKEWGGTGATAQGIAGATGSTTPTIYFGKGFGDLPDALDWLKPIAFTGTFGYQFQDVPTSTSLGQDSSGNPLLVRSSTPDLLVWGASVQYSIPYLQANIKDLGLPPFLGRITPLVELAYTSPATRSNGVRTQGTIAPGFIYSGDAFQVGVEALVPATKGSNAATGFIVQLHLFFDDLFPTTLGKPLFGD